MVAVGLLVLLLSGMARPAASLKPNLNVSQEELILGSCAVEVMLATLSNPRCSVILVKDHHPTLDTLPRRLPFGVSVFEVRGDRQDASAMRERTSSMVSEARKVGRASWCLTVVAASSDVAFLTTFARRASRSRLLRPAARLLLLTHSSLVNNSDFSSVFSKMNALTLVIEHNSNHHLQCGAYIQLPYSTPDAQAVKVALWTPQRGLALTSRLPLFPHKFFRFSSRPNLVVVTESFPTHEAVMVDDPAAPGGKRLAFNSPIANVLQLLAHTTNFTYTFVKPPDGVWGFQLEDGSWSGMLGMVSREEVDIGLGPFGIGATRAEVVDFTSPVGVYYGRIMGRRGRPEVDPWNFIFPLRPVVWTATLATLLVLPLILSLLSVCTAIRSPGRWFDDTFNFISIFLQQNIWVRRMWWWERVVVLVWMLATVVLTQSYSGNLMALLAVKHVSQPVQRLRDIVHDPSTTLMIENGSIKALYILPRPDASQVIIDLHNTNRVEYIPTWDILRSIDTLVRRGHHYLIFEDVLVSAAMARDFSLTGRCDFYVAREDFMPLPFCLVCPRGHSLVPVLSERIGRIQEAGLYNHWMESLNPNFTACTNLPTKVLIKSSLSFANLWGVFLIQACGLALSLLVLCLELLCRQAAPVGSGSPLCDQAAPCGIKKPPVGSSSPLWDQAAHCGIKKPPV
nr:probable glutamate receptor isoform X2 [Procambarus clarkii]